MKKTSEAVRASRKKAGVKPTSIGLTDEQRAKWDAFATELGLGRVAALMEAIDSYKGQGEITKERLLQELKRRLR
jgi:hypothetical protein